MKYANITMEERYQNEGNLGDYVQFIAIDHIYELMGIPNSEIIKIEYWNLTDYDGEEVILPINFFYFNPSSSGKPFILSPQIHPVYLGLHLPGEISEKEIEYFHSNTPIGCRDEYTYRIMEKALSESSAIDIPHENINLYLHGCITATLPRREEKEYKEIYLIDIPKTIEDKIPKDITANAIKMSHLLYNDLKKKRLLTGSDSAQEFVKNRLELYRDTAKLVVTSRMHCAVPCIAMGIPIVFLVPIMSSRFTWMEKLIPIYTYDEVGSINWAPKPVEYEDQKQWIIQAAINRLQGKCDLSLCRKVHDWYMCRDKREFTSGNGLELLYKYAASNWNKNEEIEYLMWGITATTEDAYNWITNNYPKARLVAVIDEYRDLDFHGINTIRSGELINYPDCYYIGTGAAASMAMKKLLMGYGEEWLNRGIPIIP